MILPMTRQEFYGKNTPAQPAHYDAPYVHPSECDHEGDEDVVMLCSQCCPCDLCGGDRALTRLQTERSA